MPDRRLAGDVLALAWTWAARPRANWAAARPQKHGTGLVAPRPVPRVAKGRARVPRKSRPPRWGRRIAPHRRCIADAARCGARLLSRRRRRCIAG
eukprot:7180517-Pyramimonas_sp.AAC.1